METTYRCLAGFLSDVNVFVLPDLKRLRNDIRPDRNGFAGCTVPTAMFAFAVLDLVGFLIRPEPPGLCDECRRRRLMATSDNIAFSLSSEGGILPPEYENNTELLLKLFRHGIMHQVLPKAAGIAKVAADSDLPLIYYQPQACPNLNVDKLADDLIRALALLENRVRSPNGNGLASQMDQRIRFLHAEGQSLLEAMKKKGLVEGCGGG